MDVIKILCQRSLRILQKDPNVPIRCYVRMYEDFEVKHCKCDCKNWCKFPPKGPKGLVSINIEQFKRKRINI